MIQFKKHSLKNLFLLLNLMICFSLYTEASQLKNSIELEVCPRFAIAGEFANRTPFAKMAELGSQILNHKNKLSELSLNQVLEKPKSEQGLFGALIYLVNGVQDLATPESRQNFQLNILPKPACGKVLDWNMAADQNKNKESYSTRIENYIGLSKVPRMPDLKGADQILQNMRSIFPYIQVAGLSLNFTNEFKRDSNGLRTAVNGSIALLLPRHFYWPMLDMYALNDEMRIDRIYFDEYLSNKHYVIINFSNLMMVKQSGLLPTFNADFKADIYFSGDVLFKFSPVSRNLTFEPFATERTRLLAKPHYQAKILLKPTRLENSAANSSFARSILDNFGTFELSLDHVQTRMRKETNPNSQLPNWYPEIVLDHSIKALFGSIPGSYEGKNHLFEIPVDGVAQKSIDSINQKIYRLFNMFYNDLQATIKQFSDKIKKCGSSERATDQCVSDLKQDLNLPTEE